MSTFLVGKLCGIPNGKAISGNKSVHIAFLMERRKLILKKGFGYAYNSRGVGQVAQGSQGVARLVHTALRQVQLRQSQLEVHRHVRRLGDLSLQQTRALINVKGALPCLCHVTQFRFWPGKFIFTCLGRSINFPE